MTHLLWNPKFITSYSGYLIIAQYGISAQGPAGQGIFPKLINTQGCHITVHYRANKRTGQEFSWKKINAQCAIIRYSRVSTFMSNE